MDRSDVIEQEVIEPKRRGARPVARLAGAAVLVGGIVIGGAALSHGGSSTTAAGASAGVGTVQLADTAQSGTSGTSGVPGNWGGPGRGAGMFGHGRGGLTVTAVNGNTISATGRGGQTVTITVNSSTKYTEAGASITLADIQKGVTIAVQGARAGQAAITATSIEIVLPTEIGKVTGVSGSTITLTGFDGATQTVTVDGATRYQKAGQSAALSDITTGVTIVAEGTTTSSGALSAKLVTIQVPRVMGQVTAVTNGSYTLSSRRENGTVTVITTTSTVYTNPDGSSAQASTIKSGTVISAEGTLSTDGKTLTALRITILPASSDNHDGFGFPGPGGRDQNGLGIPNGGSQAGSTSGTATSSTASTSSV